MHVETNSVICGRSRDNTYESRIPPLFELDCPNMDV